MTSRKLPLILAVLALLWIGAVVLLTFGSHLVIHRYGPLPSQPIEFSHTVHVNDLNLECLYCHETAEKSIHATIPKGELCLSCHEDADIDNPEIKKMLALLEEQEDTLGKPKRDQRSVDIFKFKKPVDLDKYLTKRRYDFLNGRHDT